MGDSLPGGKDNFVLCRQLSLEKKRKSTKQVMKMILSVLQGPQALQAEQVNTDKKPEVYTDRTGTN